jgi:hypothetical protein
MRRNVVFAAFWFSILWVVSPYFSVYSQSRPAVEKPASSSLTAHEDVQLRGHLPGWANCGLSSFPQLLHKLLPESPVRSLNQSPGSHTR